MIEINTDDCQVVRDSMDGRRPVDEQTFTSIAILSERLARVRRLGKNFSNIKFSSAARKLARNENIVAV